MKFVISSLNDVAEPLRGEYEERGGKFYLKTEGEFQPLIEANTKLAEFRDNNRTLNTKKTELETQLKTFEGVDPAEHMKMKEKITELEKSGVKGSSDVAEQIKLAVKTALDPVEKKLKEREQTEAIAQAALAKKSLEADLRDAGLKAGINEKAIRDYIGRGLDVFQLVDGVPVARKGDAPIFSKKDPAEFLTMDEWASSLEAEAPHLFTPSRGGGGGGDRNTGTGTKKVIGSDPMIFGQNLESIAKGETIVQQ